MSRRNLSLSSRNENTRNKQAVRNAVRFDHGEIIAHFHEGLSSVKGQMALAHTLNEKGNKEASDSICRSQIVMAESLLDFYLHKISKCCLCEMYDGVRAQSEEYSNLRVSLFRVEEAIYSKASRGWLLDQITEDYSSACFLSERSMRRQLTVIGIPYKDMLERAFPDKSGDQRAKIVSKLFARRNAIAHQGDRNHVDATLNQVDETYAIYCIDCVERIVASIHSLVVQGLTA